MAAKKTTKTQEMDGAAKIGIGIGLTAAAVAAAGAYFLLGSKNAKENRKKLRGWTLKAKGEVLESLEKAKEISATEYAELVDSAVKAYGTVERATKGEMKDFKDEMQSHWTKLQKNMAVKKMAGGAAKKAAPKKKVAAKKAK